MSYSFTEKKRIRKDFGKRRSILDVPYLLETQIRSYQEFLQLEVPKDDRRERGLHGALKSVFPIVAYSGNAALEYVSYKLGDPVFDVKECKLRGMSYGAPLRVKVRLVIYDKESSAKQKPVKYVKEQEVYMGDLPLMTETGTFIVNGTERVIVSQLHRSPGVFYDHDRGKTHSSGKLLFSARVIPYRGSWLDFEFDPKDGIFTRIDRRRKLPVTVLLRALGMNNEEILDTFFDTSGITLLKDGAKLELIPERLRGESALFDIADKKGNVIVATGKRITARHVKLMEAAGIKALQVPDDYLLTKIISHNIIDKESGEVLADANAEITEELLQQFDEQNLKIDHIVTATGSAGTHGGLVVGLRASGSDLPILGIGVNAPQDVQEERVFNLACPASPIHYQFDPVQTTKTSVHGAINMLGLAKRVRAKMFQASTSEVYGDPTVHPQKEDYWGNVNPIGIRSCYDEGKRAAETLFMDYHRMNGVDIRIVRIFNTYGPRMHPYDGRVVSNFIRQALAGEDITIFGDGSQTRSFCYVDEMVDAFVRLMNTDDKFMGPVNLGNPGSGHRRNAIDALEAVHIDYKTDMNAEGIKASESAGLLQDGRIDAFFYTVGTLGVQA